MNRVARIVAVSWLAAVFALSGGLWQVCAALTAVPAAAAEGHRPADPMVGQMGDRMADHPTVRMAHDGDAHSHHRSHPGSANPDSTKARLCAQFCAMAGVVILSDTASRVGVRFTATPVVFEHPDSRHLDGIAWLDPDIPKPIL
jgi:hypothetical protein